MVVAYGSRNGGTAEIAGWIGETLKTEGVNATVRPASAVKDLRPYPAVVLGSGVYEGRWLRSAVRFARHHRRALLDRVCRMTLAYDAAGDGPTLVLLQSAVCDRRMWDPHWPALVDAGYRLVRCDSRGFGRTPLPDRGHKDAEDVLDLPDALGIERAALIASSYGGRVAVEIAARRPDRVSAMALLCAGRRRVLEAPVSSTADCRGSCTGRIPQSGDLPAVRLRDNAQWAIVVIHDRNRGDVVVGEGFHDFLERGPRVPVPPSGSSGRSRSDASSRCRLLRAYDCLTSTLAGWPDGS